MFPKISLPPLESPAHICDTGRVQREPYITKIGAAIALAASLLATAPAAAFQPAVAVSLTHDNGGPAVQIGTEVTWTLAIAISGFESLSPDPVIESINMALTPSDTSFGFGTDFVYNTGFNGGTVGGTMANLGFTDLGFTNSLLLEGFGTPADHANPLLVGTFTTTANNAAALTYSLGLGNSVNDLVTIGLTAFDNIGFGLADVTFTSDTLVVPAPASALLLAAGLLATRRRR
ncbi:MAG: hypothetical protein ACI89L_002745 [Phycisphaerales bacterium]|jgi:hypothetical protein